jgi:hypothetical protein
MTKYSNVVINGKTLEVPAQSAVKYEQVGEIGEGNSANIEAGDVIVYEDAPFSWITVGSAYVVTEIDSDKDARIMDDEGDNYDTCGDVFTTYRKVSEKKRLTVGDYAKVVRDIGYHNYVIGSVIKIAVDDHDRKPYQADKADGTRGTWLYEHELEPATKAEFDAQKKPADPRSQFAAGDKVRLLSGGGRHPLCGFSDGNVYDVTNPLYSGHKNERVEIANGSSKGFAKPEQLVKVTEIDRFKAGSHVKIVDLSGGLAEGRLGQIAEVVTDDGSSIPYKIRFISDGDIEWVRAIRITAATAEEVAAARYAAKIGDFKDGDWAEIVNPTEANANSRAIAAKGQTVKVSLFGQHGIRGLTLTSADGRSIGFANADALRKVDEPKPAPSFVIGDKVRIAVPEGAPTRHGRVGVKNSEIGEVTGVRSDVLIVRFPSFGDGWNGLPSELVKVTEEEAVESAKWSAIGRKVNEYKAGDIVEVTGGYEEVKKGDIGVITHADGSSLPGVTVRGVQRFVQVKLVMPVEQRFDKVA